MLSSFNNDARSIETHTVRDCLQRTLSTIVRYAHCTEMGERGYTHVVVGVDGWKEVKVDVDVVDCDDIRKRKFWVRVYLVARLGANHIYLLKP